MLNLALALVSAFTNAVSIPPEEAPKSTSDLASFVLGFRNPLDTTPPTRLLDSIFDPTYVYLNTKQGAKFWIRHGVVTAYESGDSYFASQDPRLRWKFDGTAALSRNQIIDAAGAALQRLVKSGDPLADCTTNLQSANNIPFFMVHWRKTTPHPKEVAYVEIDGRSGRIVRLDVRDEGFYDRKEDERLRSASGAPAIAATSSSVETPPVQSIVFPRPTADYASAVIQNALKFTRWGRFSETLALALGTIDWSRTLICENRFPLQAIKRAADDHLCEICFNDGSLCLSVAGVVTGFYMADLPLSNTDEEKQPELDWKAAATFLERSFVENFGIDRETLGLLHPLILESPDDLKVPRDVEILWVPNGERFVTPATFPEILARINRATGRTTALRFTSPTLFSELRLAQRIYDVRTPHVNVAPGALVANTVQERGMFTINRDAYTDSALEVYYRLEGWADGKLQFVERTNSIVIPKGLLCAGINFNPLHQRRTNLAYVALTLLPPLTNSENRPAYVVGASFHTTNTFPQNEP